MRLGEQGLWLEEEECGRSSGNLAGGRWGSSSAPSVPALGVLAPPSILRAPHCLQLHPAGGGDSPMHVLCLSPDVLLVGTQSPPPCSSRPSSGRQRPPHRLICCGAELVGGEDEEAENPQYALATSHGSAPWRGSGSPCPRSGLSWGIGGREGMG